MFLVVLSYLAFFSIALPDSMLSVAWPTMRISFEQPISAAGLVPPLGVAATLVSTPTPRGLSVPGASTICMRPTALALRPHR